jgi:hypothetical protein
VILVGLFVAAGTVSLAPVLAAAPTAATPCATMTAVHPHLDPHKRVPALVKTSGSAGQHTDVVGDGGEGAGHTPAHTCVQKVVDQWELDRHRRL